MELKFQVRWQIIGVRMSVRSCSNLKADNLAALFAVWKFPNSIGIESCCCTGWHKKTATFEKPNKNWRNPRKKIIDKNWTITTCLLRDSNPNYQCLKITSCRWRPPPCMHSFTATTHFKSSRSFVSPCVCCMLCRIRQSRILQSMQQDVIFKHW